MAVRAGTRSAVCISAQGLFQVGACPQYVAPLTVCESRPTTRAAGQPPKEHAMATVTWIGFGQMGRPMGTDLRAAGPTVRGRDLASDADFAQLVGGVR